MTSLLSTQGSMQGLSRPIPHCGAMNADHDQANGVSFDHAVFRTWVTTSWSPRVRSCRVLHCIALHSHTCICNHAHMHSICTYICTALAYTCIHICIALAYAHIALALEGQTAKRREITGTSCVQFQQICSQAAMFSTARRVSERCQFASQIAKPIKLHMQQPWPLATVCVCVIR